MRGVWVIFATGISVAAPAAGDVVPSEPAETVEPRTTKECDAGTVAACARLVKRHIEGFASVGNLDRARDVLSAGCNEGESAACSALGRLYDRGWGTVAGDPESASLLFRKACDARDAAGCSGLADLYEMGRGVRRDPARAAELYMMACAVGDPAACDPARASRWKHRASGPAATASGVGRQSPGRDVEGSRKLLVGSALCGGL